ncbi:MAG: hypothetical protein WD468_00930 [Pirellulales bacterium]
MIKAVQLALLTILFAYLIANPAWADSQAESIDLSPHIEANTLTRVTIDLDAGGNDVVRAATDAQGADANNSAERKLPMSVSAKLQYDERRIVGTAGDVPQNLSPLAIRYYNRAEGVLKVDTSGMSPKLADDRRLIMVESGAARPNLYSPDGPLSREQLDLIDVTGNSCLVDRLLPAKTVASGATWKNEAAVMGGLLTLDSVAVCEAQSVLDEFNASFAKIRLAGVVHGTADGAATQREVRGVYLFDRRLRRVTRLNLAVREMRSIGAATPGLQGVGKLQIKIDPISSSPQLTDRIVAKATRAGRTSPLNLVYKSAPLGFRAAYDRQWYITSEGRETITMRRVDGSDVVAQCTVTKLPSKSLGRQVPLDQFQKDVAYSLGKSFGQLVSSRQWTNAAGHHCFEVVVRGTVEELPVEWHYFLVAPDSGHRISLAFMMEGSIADRLNQADRRLVEAVELIQPPTQPAETAAQPAETTTK